MYLCVVIVLLLLRNDGNIQSPKGKEKPKATEDIMNTKTARQIEEMKKQTIGVEIEMNSISRSKAAKLASQFFRNRSIQKHSRPQRLLHILGLGRARQRVEIPKRC